jgi:4-diphosphocytidyl-2-C-methyl-D-erythritol kinase
MIAFPNCKINLGLHVISRRNDGYHDLETVFYPLSFSDCLEMIPSQDGNTVFSSSGLEIPPDGSDNLCVKAWKLMHSRYNIPPVKIHLHKAIPTGSGLGGGSSDAAFTLKTLNDYFATGLNTGQLKELGAELGSDCAFFIENQPCFATGRGEILEPVTLSLRGKYILLVVPPVHVSTRDAFSGIIPRKPQESLPQLLQKDIYDWKDTLTNDFEKVIFKKFPEIKSIKDHLYGSGAVYASMSGSGSAVYGIFDKNIDQVDWEKEFPGSFTRIESH